jgi:hypothetical protein
MLAYHRVPQQRRANHAWRRELTEHCQADKGYRRAVRLLCKHDILFWANACLYTFDPRLVTTNPHLPFITWDYQDEMTRTRSNMSGCRTTMWPTFTPAASPIRHLVGVVLAAG